mmetsp:Transcript_27073/g.56732  ORF Transcript_27073/g.56732 Transcript_27073/m.56732 type:complete len:145 (+) Transcript_27073:487-921(+)
MSKGLMRGMIVMTKWVPFFGAVDAEGDQFFEESPQIPPPPQTANESNAADVGDEEANSKVAAEQHIRVGSLNDDDDDDDNDGSPRFVVSFRLLLKQEASQRGRGFVAAGFVVVIVDSKHSVFLPLSSCIDCSRSNLTVVVVAAS